MVEMRTFSGSVFLNAALRGCSQVDNAFWDKNGTQSSLYKHVSSNGNYGGSYLSHDNLDLHSI